MNTASLKQDYKERIVPVLMKEFGYSTVMQCPKLEKIVLNQGLGIAVADKMSKSFEGILGNPSFPSFSSFGSIIFFI